MISTAFFPRPRYFARPFAKFFSVYFVCSSHAIWAASLNSDLYVVPGGSGGGGDGDGGGGEGGGGDGIGGGGDGIGGGGEGGGGGDGGGDGGGGDGGGGAGGGEDGDGGGGGEGSGDGGGGDGGGDGGNPLPPPPCRMLPSAPRRRHGHASEFAQ